VPTIIDSLFLELGIDTSKFSKDQQRALEKIKQFESETRKSADKAAGRVKKVGEAFRDIADETAIGASARRLDTMAVKLKALGQAGRVSGGVTGGLGMMAEGLGTLLSPATLALTAVTALGVGVWDFDKKMTAANATIFRQAQLSGMSAKNLWAWGEAAKSVGASPGSVTGGIASLQTAVTGMGIGAGNATAQLVALARLGGVGYNFQSGVNIKQLFERVHQLAKKSGYQNLGALRALTSPLMNSAMFELATSPTFNPDDLQAQIKRMEPPGFGKILAGAVKSQQELGLLSASKDTLMERAYGATHNVFDAMAVGIQQLVGYVSAIWNFLSHPAKALHHAEHLAHAVLHGAEKGWKAGGMFGALHGAVEGYHGAVNASVGRKMMPMVNALMAQGLSRGDAEAMAGNFMQESSLNPFARNGSHFGLAQWDQSRQALARRNGFDLSTESGQVQFAAWELRNTPYGRQALARMRAAKTLQGKTLALDAFFERSGEVAYRGGKYGIMGVQNLGAVMNRLKYAGDAQAAMHYAATLANAAHARPHVVHSTTTHHTRIDAVNVATQATDAEGMAAGARKALSTHPMITPSAQHQVTLSSHGMAG
jgi:uncharacterized protein YoaH (UPF0181 family)